MYQAGMCHDIWYRDTDRRRNYSYMNMINDNLGGEIYEKEF